MAREESPNLFACAEFASLVTEVRGMRGDFQQIIQSNVRTNAILEQVLQRLEKGDERMDAADAKLEMFTNHAGACRTEQLKLQHTHDLRLSQLESSVQNLARTSEENGANIAELVAAKHRVEGMGWLAKHLPTVGKLLAGGGLGAAMYSWLTGGK